MGERGIEVRDKEGYPPESEDVDEPSTLVTGTLGTDHEIGECAPKRVL